MKRFIAALAILVMFGSCVKDRDYDIRDGNAGKLQYNWILDWYAGPETGNKIVYASKDNGLGDDELKFNTNRTGTRWQGKKKFAPWTDQMPEFLDFTWEMDPHKTSTVNMIGKDAISGQVTGKNIAIIDASENKLTITNIFTVAGANGDSTAYTRTYGYHGTTNHDFPAH